MRPGSPEKALTEEDIAFIGKLQKEIKKAEENIPRIIKADSPKETEQGLAKLILTISSYKKAYGEGGIQESEEGIAFSR